MTQSRSGGAVTAVLANSSANCVDASCPQQWLPDLLFFGGGGGIIGWSQNRINIWTYIFSL